MSTKRLPVINPATEEVVGEIPNQGAREVAAAVARARAAFPQWRRTPAQQRAELLQRIARGLRDKSESLAVLLTQEGGKPLRENRDEVGWAASTFDYYAGLCRTERGRVIPSIEASQLAFVLHEPYGVVGAIVPWNYPLLLAAWKLAPALAAGNTVVLKPPKQTPLSTVACREIYSGLPAGVVEIVTGAGVPTGEALVRDPGTDLIAFTGSLEMGKQVAAACAEMVKKTHLELGGKDAFVVCADSDLEVAVRAVAWAAFLNTGQVCTSTERVYVHRSIYKRFLDRLKVFTESLKIGDGMDPKTDVGPLIGAQVREKVEEHVAQALRLGAKLVCGGRRPARLKKGFFYEPTVLAGVDHRMRVMSEETFGPVCPVMPYEDFDEAVRLVNDSPYGLGANLYTRDAQHVKAFFEDVQAGTIWVNDPLTDNDAGPFGGFKASGSSRELGEEGLREFQQAKHVHWDFEQKAKPWWYPYGARRK